MSSANGKNSLEAQLGERIRNLRLEKGFTQQELADLLGSILDRETPERDRGWHQPDISDLEHGRRWPRTDVLHALAKIFRVKVDDIVSIPNPIKAAAQKGGRADRRRGA